MLPLFVGLTLVNLLCLSMTTALGYLVSTSGRFASAHILSGALSAIACCAVHCVVITYFVATAKWVQHAVSVKGLDEALISPTRSFKANAFPAALLAMLSVFVAAVCGAGADNYHGSWRLWHHALALMAVAVNVAVAPIEYRAIARNGRLIDSVLARIARADE